jgi:hypothetical protein
MNYLCKGARAQEVHYCFFGERLGVQLIVIRSFHPISLQCRPKLPNISSLVIAYRMIFLRIKDISH